MHKTSGFLFMSDDAFPKAYEAQQYEDDIYQMWEDSGMFNPDNLPGERDESFSMVLPPPNVTGTLHIGHAVMLAIEDILTRFARLRGKKTLWLPGTDHAAIATQAKVERLLIEEEGYNDPRHELGREEFLKRVEAFAQESHDTIVSQAKKMGASMDWSREAYTLDDERNFAVRTAFKRMYDDGLIYRGDRVVNWCPRCKSTLSDDELEYKETETKLYTFKYSEDIPVVISTTRPETKVGDTAIAVYPDDERYEDHLGETFETEFAGSGLRLNVVGHHSVDPEFGSGALGVTPAHSHTDFMIAREHDLDMRQVIGEDGRMTAEAGELVEGMTVKEAREKIVAWLEESGLMESVEDTPQNLSICYRCDTPVEPLPKLQWFIDVNAEFPFRQSKDNPIEGIEDGEAVTLKQVMKHVVETEQIEIIPDRFEKTYFHWINDLRDWNISRQIWFGHRVPVWYKGEETYVGIEPPEGEGWEQDPDTLDTWFSSGLWTISTLGWPNDTKDLETFHPTSVLETGYDILFFWVARMVLMTTYCVGEVPFEDVYLHGLVRDEQGRKMSKSLGNVIDPLDTISEYGADATRLALVIGSTPGNDSKVSEDKIAGFRNFTNKLWNISRFILTSVEESGRVTADDLNPRTLPDRWILNEFNEVLDDATDMIDDYRLSAAGERLRTFSWSKFADWYLEIAKQQREQSAEARAETDKILMYILERLLICWHPFMPFVTEEIWKRFDAEELLLVQSWPMSPNENDRQAKDEFRLIQDVVVGLRNIRADYKLSPHKSIDATIVSANLHNLYEEQVEVIKHLANVDNLEVKLKANEQDKEGAASDVIGKETVYVPLSGLVDLDKEKERLQEELEDKQGYIRGLEKKLDNDDFVENAPDEVVEQTREKKRDAQQTVESLKEQLETISNV
jgi:valyl-tRNA synthetase